MTGMVWLWMALCGGASAAEVTEDQASTATLGPPPVELWARRDIRATRRARVGLLVALSGPGLFVVGTNALVNFDFEEESRQTAFGSALVTVGALGILVGPPLLVEATWRSSKALRRQGLRVPPTAAIVAGALYVGAAVSTISTISTIPGAGQQWRVVVPLFAYGASVGMGALQFQQNLSARKRAGWLGVVPLLRDGASGIAIALTF